MKAWTDGSSKNGVAQGGVYFDDGTKFAVGFGHGTSNEAEYLAVLTAVQYCADNAVRDLHIYTDSLLVVNQVNGAWKVKHKHLRTLRNQIREYIPLFERFVLQYVPREENKMADGLSKAALGEDKNVSWE
jgi:ribonuclease HI